MACFPAEGLLNSSLGFVNKNILQENMFFLSILFIKFC